MSAEAIQEFKILIVDDHGEVARVLRTSLELMDQGYKIFDVPSGEEAMLEVPRGPFDLLVAEYMLPGMGGLELIERLRRHNDNMKSIITADHDDVAEMTEEFEAAGVFRLLHKPIETEDFTLAVEEALHGPITAAAPRSDSFSDKLGSIPEIDDGLVSLILDAMRADLGAHAVMLVDRMGRVVKQTGTIGEDLRFSELSVLLASNLTTTGEISTYLGDEPPAALHFYDGGNYDIYSLALGLHFFVAIVFPAGSERQLGAVVRFGARAVTELLPMVGSEEVARIDEFEAVTVDEEPVDEVYVEEAEAEVEEAISEDYEFEADEEEIEITAPESIDLDALEVALEADADAGADDFWDVAVAEDETSISSSKSISIEDAMDLGLIPNDMDN